MGFVVAGVAAAGVASAGIGAISAQNAANTQASATKDAANTVANVQLQAQQNLQPYNTNGQAALGNLNAQYGNTNTILNNYLSAANAQLPGTMTQAQLANTPGYQFSLSQGLLGAQNAEAGAGLGISGNAIRAGESYAQGLASTTYNQQLANQNTVYGAYTQQLNNAVQQQQLLYNEAAGPAQLGEAAGAQQATNLTTSGAQQASLQSLAGTQLASGTIGASNAVSGGLNSLGGAGLTYALNGGGGGSSYATLPAGYSAQGNYGIPTPDANGSIPINSYYQAGAGG